MKTSSNEAVQTIERASQIVGIVTRHAARGARLKDVVEESDLGKSTAYRLLTALVRAGVLDQDPRDRTYFLGYRLLGLAEIAADRFSLAEIATPFLEDLAEATGETVYLSVRDGDDSVCLARVSGSFPVKILALNVGDRNPLGRGSGSLAILADLPAEDAAAIIARNYRAWPDEPELAPERIRAVVQRARRAGYVRTDGRVLAGLSALAVSVKGHEGQALAAISIAGVSSRLPNARTAELLAALRDRAGQIEINLARRLGPAAGRVVRRRAVK